MPGIEVFNRTCECGSRPHEPVIGKERSKKSAEYRGEFCTEYMVSRQPSTSGTSQSRSSRRAGCNCWRTAYKESRRSPTTSWLRHTAHRRGLEHKRACRGRSGASVQVMLRADRTAVEKTPLEIEGAFQGYAPRRRLRATSTSPCRRQAHRRTHKLAAQKWI